VSIDYHTINSNAFTRTHSQGFFQPHFIDGDINFSSVTQYPRCFGLQANQAFYGFRGFTPCPHFQRRTKIDQGNDDGGKWRCCGRALGQFLTGDDGFPKRPKRRWRDTLKGFRQKGGQHGNYSGWTVGNLLKVVDGVLKLRAGVPMKITGQAGENPLERASESG